MNATGRIPTSWKVRWKQIRIAVLPWLGFLVSLVLTIWFWTGQTAPPQAVGETESLRVELAAGSAGLLAPLPREAWTLYEPVEAGQVLARLDDRALRAQMTVLTEELARLHKSLDSARAKWAVEQSDRERSYQSTAMRLRFEAERQRLAVLEKHLQREVDRLEAERTRTVFDCLQPLAEKKMVSELELTTARLARDAAAKRLVEDEKLLLETERQQQEAERRIAEFREGPAGDMERELAPLGAAAEVQRARIRELDAGIELLAIRAPIRGRICAIHHQAGENVQAGAPILTLAAESGRYIVSYVRREQRLRPQAGMAVALRPRAAGGAVVRSVVEQVGPQVEAIPLHLCRDPRVPEWGVPARIALPAQLDSRPGELFEVTFLGDSNGKPPPPAGE